MKKLISILIILLGLMMPVMANAQEGYHCGDRVRISATPQEGYHFVRWSDGVTDNPREIDIEDNVDLVAYFEPNCGTYANVGIIRLYDWLLMINRADLEQHHYIIKDEDIRWYRIVGDIDDAESFGGDDQLVGTGYYLTLGQNLTGTGDYYAVIDVSRNASNEAECTTYMYTEVASYTAQQAASGQLRLSPNHVRRNEPIEVSGLVPDAHTKIWVYDAVGKLITEYTSDGTAIFTMPAVGVAGCYLVHVQSGEKQDVLRYIVE